MGDLDNLDVFGDLEELGDLKKLDDLDVLVDLEKLDDLDELDDLDVLGYFEELGDLDELEEYYIFGIILGLAKKYIFRDNLGFVVLCRTPNSVWLYLKTKRL